MKGRVSYYLKKAVATLANEGARSFLVRGFDFLLRRKFFIQFLSEIIEFVLLSRMRNIDESIIKVLKEREITGKKVLLYASYDANSLIQSNVLMQLQGFSDVGYEIVFVTTSPKLSSDQFNRIEKCVSVAIHRKNEGYDFASWKAAFQHANLDITSLESFIIMNDSCLGPLYSLSVDLHKMETSTNSIYGISKSEEIETHIQSYFYHFGREVLKTQVVENFFSRIRILNSKWAIVRFYEIGSARLFKKNNIPMLALVDPELDPTVKIEMTKYNLSEPTREPLASEWVKRRLSPFYKKSAQKDILFDRTI